SPLRAPAYLTDQRGWSTTDATRDGAGAAGSSPASTWRPRVRHVDKGRTSMRFTEPKITVAANLQQDVPGLLAQADGVVAGIEGHPGYFPNANPVVQAIKDARKTLGDTHIMSAPLKKAGKARSPAERALRNRLTDGARFVETCANNDLANASA